MRRRYLAFRSQAAWIGTGLHLKERIAGLVDSINHQDQFASVQSDNRALGRSAGSPSGLQGLSRSSYASPKIDQSAESMVLHPFRSQTDGYTIYNLLHSPSTGRVDLRPRSTSLRVRYHTGLPGAGIDALFVLYVYCPKPSATFLQSEPSAG
jgi:hypothetical protein